MNSINLIDAAKFYNDLSHQKSAWQWLQDQLTTEQIDGFAEQYRSAPPPQAPETALITADQCNAIFGRDITPDQLVDLNSCLDRFDIDTPARIRHFIAQIAHESGGLRWLQELASGKAYEGRRDLGNTQPGDGTRFKGAGAIQLTGRFNYEQFAKSINDMRVMEGCSYVASQYPFTSAGFWWNKNHMNSLVDSGASCRQISERVNGRDPANGLQEREDYFATATKFIPDSVSPTQAEKPAGVSVAGGNPLDVPYFYQLDSAVFAQGEAQADRMCFSSSCAMLLEFLKPGTLPGPNGDDIYLKKVFTYGDTTDAASQIQALESFGLKARFNQNCDFSIIEEQINRGIPVPCGFLHHGHVDAPTGGGHWLCVVGYTPTGVIVNDPFGDMDLINGTYVNRVAKGLQYSHKNFGRRWMVLDNGTYAPGKGWAIIAEPPN
jgi:putative chitinase